MELTTGQIERVLDQFESEVIPSDSPMMPRLKAVYGKHTFFVAEMGLHLVERSASTNSHKHPAYVVRVAGWTDETRTSIAPLDPEVVYAVDLAGSEAPH